MIFARLGLGALTFAFPFAALFASPRAHGDWGVAYPPRDPDSQRPAPAIVFLHGMWASPEDSCAPFEGAATPFGFLVCPRGNARLRDPSDPEAGETGDKPDGGPGLKMWSGSAADAARAIHAALEAADRLAPGRRTAAAAIGTVGGTLIGFSNGAYFAAEVACAEPGRWTGLVLMSMKLDLDAGRLRRAGVRRVVLAAGDRDEARASMEALAESLRGGGIGRGGESIEARYMSLGDVGHSFPGDMGSRMCAAISWVRSAPESSCSASEAQIRAR